jgi:hypothetical protein
MVVAMKNGTLQVWEMKRFINEKKIEKIYSIPGEHISIRYIMALNVNVQLI